MMLIWMGMEDVVFELIMVIDNFILFNNPALTSMAAYKEGSQILMAYK